MEVDNFDRLSQQTSQTLSEFGESTPEGSEFVIQDYFIRDHSEFDDEDYSSNFSETSDVYQEENVSIIYKQFSLEIITITILKVDVFIYLKKDLKKSKDTFE